MNKEIRTRDISFSTGENKLSGQAIVFNSVSNVLYDRVERKFFREVIAPEAVTEALIASSDIKLVVDHSKDKLLARSRQGKGSLNLSIREDGLYFECDCPNTTLGHDMYELIKRGDYSQMSFAFIDGQERGDVTWDFSEEIPTRTVHKIAELFDISIVQSPAFDATSVSARSIEEAQEVPQEEPAVEEVPSNEVSEEPVINTIEEPQEEARDNSYLEELNRYKEIVNSL
jgi:hypothetical protein